MHTLTGEADMDTSLRSERQRTTRYVITYWAGWPVGLRYTVRRNTKRSPLTRTPWPTSAGSKPMSYDEARRLAATLNRGEAFAHGTEAR